MGHRCHRCANELSLKTGPIWAEAAAEIENDRIINQRKVGVKDQNQEADLALDREAEVPNEIEIGILEEEETEIETVEDGIKNGKLDEESEIDRHQHQKMI